jgi:hypothetical protein
VGGLAAVISVLGALNADWALPLVVATAAVAAVVSGAIAGVVDAVVPVPTRSQTETVEGAEPPMLLPHRDTLPTDAFRPRF